MSFNHNVPGVLSAASIILSRQVDFKSFNGIVSGVHARFLKQDSKSNYSNKHDYANAIFLYEQKKLSSELSHGKAAISSSNFHALIQDPTVYNHIKSYFESLY
jgi:hypothetical protein